MAEPTSPVNGSHPRLLLSLIEKQGIAVAILLVVIAWASGIIPFRLCESLTNQAEVIQAMEADRRLMVAGIIKISEAVQRMDTRDQIKTCASIPDKDARLACLQVAGTGR